MKLKVKREEQGQHFNYLKKLEFDSIGDSGLLPPGTLTEEGGSVQLTSSLG
jgi:hypothetical protein